MCRGLCAAKRDGRCGTEVSVEITCEQESDMMSKMDEHLGNRDKRLMFRYQVLEEKEEQKER